MSDMINPGDNEYPKMVYPDGNDVKHTAVGNHVIVNSKEEEAEVMGEKKPKAKGWNA